MQQGIYLFFLSAKSTVRQVYAEEFDQFTAHVNMIFFHLPSNLLMQKRKFKTRVRAVGLNRGLASNAYVTVGLMQLRKGSFALT